MHTSVFLRRILSLLIGAILLAAVLTLAFFYFVTSDIVYTNLAANDFRKKASILSERTEDFLLGEYDRDDYMSMLDITPEMMNATMHIFIFDAESDSFVLSPQGSDLDASALAEAEAMMQAQMPELKAGRSVELRSRLGDGAIETLMIGYPVEVFDRSTGSRNIRASIFLSRSIDNIRMGYDSLNFALVLASGISVLIMIFPTYLAINRLIRPLKQVKDVATAMSNGNFTLRADSNQPGEIGELAAAINDLAADLDRTITALMQERNRLRQILDGLHEGIIAVDKSLRITHSNQATVELLGRTDSFRQSREKNKGLIREDSEQETDESAEIEYYLSSDLQLDRDYQQAIDSGKIKTRSFPHHDRIILLAVSPLTNENDEIIGAVGLLRDVTASEKLEQTRRDYIANVSHELRTPLTALRGLIEPLADGLVRDVKDQQRYYNIILDETLRLSRLIDDMLELSRLQAGKISLKREAFEIWDVFNTIKGKYEFVASEKGIFFALPAYDSDCPPAYANMDRVEQVLVILLDNAIKFTEKDGIVEITASWDSDKIVVAVKDTGIGISKEDQAHVFERFFKSDKSRGQMNGTGLGLSIAREMVQQMGERMWVRSQMGQGSTFFFTLSKYKEN